MPTWASFMLAVALLALTTLLTVVAAEAPQPMRPAGRTPLCLDGNYGGNRRFAHREPDTLVLGLSPDLFARWRDAGGTVESGAIVPDTSQIEIIDPL